MPQSGGYAQSGYGGTGYSPTYAQNTAARFGLAGAGLNPTAPAAAPAPSYAQSVAQRFGIGGQPQPQQNYTQPSYNPQGFGLAGAGLTAGGVRPPAPQAGSPVMQQMTSKPAAAAPAGQGQGQYVNGQWIPTITQTTTLSPETQKLFDQQQQLQGQAGTLAGTLMGNVPTAPMSFANAPGMPSTGDQPNQQAIDAVYQQQTNMLDPQWNLQEQQLRDSLRDQGIPEGSDAYNQQMQLFNNNKTMAYQQARDSAVQEGYNVAQQTFGQGMAARQQGVAEAQNLYTQPASTLAQLMAAYQGGGGVQIPQANYNPAQISPTDVLGAANTYAGQQQSNYQNQANIYGQNVGGLSGLAGMLALAAGGSKGLFG